MRCCRGLSTIVVCVAMGIFCGRSLDAAPGKAGGSRIIVSPSVRLLQALAGKELRFLPKGIADKEGFVASLRFDQELPAVSLRGLELGGIQFARVVSPVDVDHIGPIYPVWVPWSSLEWLESFPGLVQIDSEYLRKPVRSLNVTRPLTGAPELSQLLALNKGEKPGQGINIGDVDSGIDVFHPAFFNADGGYFTWLDTNGDGSLTPGVDAVDYNADGVADASEVLRLIDTGVINPYDGQNGWTDVHGNGQFDLSYDVLYVDSNGNSVRDYGKKSGFTDQTPGFGEPMFVCDDVNQDGVMDPNEKLVLLGSSKVAKLWVGKTPYVRGTNLSEVYSLETFGSDPSGYPTALHGTGVSGILVAGNPGFQRFVGMAPAANLHMYDNTHDAQDSWYDNSMVEKLVWAKNDGIDIMLYEFSMWGTTFMDGSSNLEMAMDQIYDKNGILNVVPAGNLGGAGKHMQTEVGVSGTEVSVEVPTKWSGYDAPFETPGLIVSFYWKGQGDELAFTLTPPGGQATVVPANGPSAGIELAGNQVLYSYAMQSGAGFNMQMFMVYDGAQVAIPSGDWKFAMANTKGETVPVHGFLMDYVAGWERTVIWKQFESDDTTICNPSTADSAITVAAFAGQFGGASELGKLRGYSSHGPRMDGVLGTDIGAPDDPYSALPEMNIGWEENPDIVSGAYMVFGGTSGAGPHVAGTLALLLQAHPDMGASAWRQALLDGALAEDHMGELPNKKWGSGKLNVFRAVTGGWPPVANQPPVAFAEVKWREGLYALLSVKGSVDADQDVLEFRWDFNYDGQWDTPWSTDGDVEYGAKEAGLVRAKLVVRDPLGAQDEYLLVFMADDQIIRPEEPVDLEMSREDVAGEDGIGQPDVHDVAVAEMVSDDVAAGDTGASVDAKGDSDLVTSVPASGCAASNTPDHYWALWLLATMCVLGLLGRKSVRRPGENSPPEFPESRQN